MIGFGIGLPFAYVLALVCLAAAVGWLVTGRPRIPASVLRVNVVGGVAFAVTGLLMARPYLRVVEAHPYARRGEEDLPLFSPPLRGFLTAPAESWFWGERHAGARAELLLRPRDDAAPRDHRAAARLRRPGDQQLVPAAAPGLGRAHRGEPAVRLGTRFQDGEFTYLLLFRHAPGWDALRTPGRLVIYTTLLLGLLAAGAVTGLGNRLAARGAPGHRAGRGRGGPPPFC